MGFKNKGPLAGKESYSAAEKRWKNDWERVQAGIKQERILKEKAWNAKLAAERAHVLSSKYARDAAPSYSGGHLQENMHGVAAPWSGSFTPSYSGGPTQEVMHADTLANQSRLGKFFGMTPTPDINGLPVDYYPGSGNFSDNINNHSITFTDDIPVVGFGGLNNGN